MSYGVANTRGQVGREEIAAILAVARAQGVTTLDTAIAYGDSERRLGQADVSQWQVVTKLPPLPDECEDVADWVDQSVAGSLQRLQLSKLHAVLLHRSRDLLGPRADALYRALQALKQHGKAEKIGISIYEPEELDLVYARYALDLVQAPFNIVDRRLQTSGWLARLSSAGVEVHVRSIFLQGLLLMDRADRAGAFERWQPLWDEWHAWLGSAAVSPLQACLAFALSRREVDRVVVGIDGLRQLEQILACAPCAIDVPDSLACDDSELINPSRWKLS